MDKITDRLNSITNIPAEYLVECPPIPKSVKIELTTKCNYKCAFCSRKSENSKDKDMDWDLFVKITKELAELGVTEIGPFLIGEPFIAPELLIKAMEFLKQELKIPYVFITTNGSRAKPEYVGKLMSLGLDSIKWSANYHSWEHFERLTGVPTKYFILAKRNIKSAWDLRNEKGYSTKLYASSIRFDDRHVKMAQQFLDKHVHPYVDEFYWLPLYSMGGTHKTIDYKSEKIGEVSYVPIKGNIGRYDAPVPPVPCWSLFTAAHI